MRRTIPVTTIIIGLALSGGCAAEVPRLDGLAAPAGAATPSTSPASRPPSSAPPTPSSAPTSPSTPPSASPSPSTSPSPTLTEPTPSPRRTTSTTLVLGPTGLGRLTIGMTVAQAKATDMIVSYRGGGAGCGSSALRGAPGDGGSVIHSARLGVIAIPAHGSIRTPEGIRIGSSLDEVRRAYSDLTFSDVDETRSEGTGRLWADINDGDNVSYRMSLVDNRVRELGLERVNQDCYE